MRIYCVVYLSPDGIHYRYRCTANNKAAARKICKKALGIANEDIVEIYIEEYDLNDFYTIMDVIEDLHVSKMTMCKILKIKSFPSINIGSETLIPKNAYQKWLEENEFPYIKQGNLILIPIKEFNEWTNNIHNMLENL